MRREVFQSAGRVYNVCWGGGPLHLNGEPVDPVLLETLKVAAYYAAERNLDHVSRILESYLVVCKEASEARCLLLHLGGILAFEQKDPEKGKQALAEAADIEKTSGYEKSSLQTRHTMAFLSSARNPLLDAMKYFEETSETLKKMRNKEGIALCFSCLGQLAFLAGRARDASNLWGVSAKLFNECGLKEHTQMAIWIRFLKEQD